MGRLHSKKTKSISGAPTGMRLWWLLLRLVRAERLSWNSQYRRGIWQADRGERSAALIEMTANLCRGGRLVELGCGEGSLARQLPSEAYSTYQGIDISSVAIDRARTENARAEFPERCAFECADIASWGGEENVSVIVAEECLYYLPPESLRALLEVCRASLAADDGRLIVVVHSESKHAATLDVIRECLFIEDERRLGGRTYLVASRPARS